jgi:hypothetical protein
VSRSPTLPFPRNVLQSELGGELERALADLLAMEALPTAGAAARRRTGVRRLPDRFPRLLALYGKKRAGKTSMGLFLERRYAGVVQIGFSEPIMAEVNAWLRESGLPHVIDDVNKAHPRYRYVLQMWSQARTLCDARYWLDPLEGRIQHALAAGARTVVLPGLRLPSEKEEIERIGGQVWKIVRVLGEDDADRTDAHLTETALDCVPEASFARVLRNDASSLLGWLRIVRAAVEDTSSG